MMLTTRWVQLVAAAVLALCTATPAAAQTGSNTGAISLSGGFDFSNAYMFRGLRQEEADAVAIFFQALL